MYGISPAGLKLPRFPKLLHTLADEGAGAVVSQAVAPDSRIFARGSMDSTLRLYALHEGYHLASVDQRYSSVAVAFDASSGFLASATSDSKVHILAVDTIKHP